MLFKKRFSKLNLGNLKDSNKGGGAVLEGKMRATELE